MAIVINWDAEHIVTTFFFYFIFKLYIIVLVGKDDDDDDDDNCLQPVAIKILFFSNLIF